MAAEFDSFDGLKVPERCTGTSLVNQFQLCQDTVSLFILCKLSLSRLYSYPNYLPAIMILMTFQCLNYNSKWKESIFSHPDSSLLHRFLSLCRHDGGGHPGLASLEGPQMQIPWRCYSRQCSWSTVVWGRGEILFLRNWLAQIKKVGILDMLISLLFCLILDMQCGQWVGVLWEAESSQIYPLARAFAKFIGSVKNLLRE